jgi:hypothetical protein
MDPQALPRIDEVVKQFVEQGRMFTAFEVSLAVKETGIRERHRNLRDRVHASIAEQAGDNYTRTLRDVGAPVQAWVYHRLRDNPYNYVPLDRSGHDSAPAAASAGGRAVAAAPRNPQPLSATPSAPANESDGAYGTDQQGRLVISAAVLDTLGVAAGQTVDMACDKDNQEIRLSRPSVLAAAHQQLQVDADGKLRITADHLQQADLHGMQCYRIRGRGNLVTIRDFS